MPSLFIDFLLCLGNGLLMTYEQELKNAKTQDDIFAAHFKEIKRLKELHNHEMEKANDLMRFSLQEMIDNEKS